MGALLGQIEFWHWWILAVVLMILELLVPAAFFMWIAASAAVVGVVLLIVPSLSWELQLAAWAVLSIASVGVSRKILKRHPIETDDETLNRRGSQYVGRSFTLDEPIVHGQGKLKVDDTTWKIEADEDFPAGATVKVTAVDVTVLKVEKA